VTAPSAGTPGVNGSNPAEIEADIERQRDELASTVDALHARLDVKTRARHKAEDLRDRATTSTGRPRPELLGVGGLAVAVVVGLVALRRRRR
jgi:MYXO-CTERM domain-containing protein